MVPMTIADSAKHSPDDHTRTPSAARTPAVTTASATGKTNESRRLESVGVRHASSGPTPGTNNRPKATGTLLLLKNDAVTVTLCHETASLNVGNIVANRTKRAENSSTQ